MDPFREVSRSQWPNLRDCYLTNWPFCVEGYCFLDMLIKYPGIVSSFNISVYCPNGDINKGMIAVSNIESYHLYICPISLENMSELEAALLSTTIVDWHKDIIVPSMTPELIQFIDRIGEKLKLEVKCSGFAIKYLYRKDAAPFTNLVAPLQTHVSPLKCEDLDTIDSTWTFHSCTSKQFFRRLMDNNLTYVLYSDSNVPLAWINVDEMGALSHLYSIEACRRQGYASFITKTAVNDLLSKGQNVLTYALADNFAAQRLFVRLGFQNLGMTYWVYLTKKDLDLPSCSLCQTLDFNPVFKQQPENVIPD